MGIDAEAEAEAAASAVAVAAISSDESVCSAREPMSMRITNMKNSFVSTSNHSGIYSISITNLAWSLVRFQQIF